MSSKSLGNILRITVVAAALCGLLLCAYIIPEIGKGILLGYPEFSHWFTPWLVFAWLFAIPCFAILALVWRVSGAVIDDTVFTAKTAKWVKAGSAFAFAEAGILLLGNLVMGWFGMNHPTVLLASFFGEILILALALLASVLSRYLAKAAILQEESEGTL